MVESGDIDSLDCRIWAEAFSLEKIAPRYTDYFKTVIATYGGGGWYEGRPDRKNLDTVSITNEAFF